MRLLRRQARFETADQVWAVQKLPVQLVWRLRKREPKVRVSECKLKPRRQHSDYRVTLAVDRYCAPEGGVISAKPSLPESIGQHSDFRTVRYVFAGLKRAANERIHAKH